MKIYGNLICQNGIAEIARCIESVVPVVDKYLVMDGGSTDGTWEWLNKWKDVYRLTLFQNPYKSQGEQRNLLLSKTPKDVWVVNIDQDEQLGITAQCEFKNLISRISPELYTSTDRKLPLTISVRCINLVQNLNHFNSNVMPAFAIKVFYNDRNLRFTHGYHMSITYEKKDEVVYVNSVPAPKEWVIKHYAYLDPERIKNSPNDKKRYYLESEWNEKNWKITQLPPAWL